ncbi:Na+/H+ antiporter NhaA [Novosphingobium sp.]|uniref:Na+/H+ antiporter NhaA n=1 Tax=Novosphingobium sp. TaxID=1874826 RepID=UPI0027330214|nr:Na+/H+ antiporter NhaA [Novosphingobium sp.]MDP3905828.1 Na+/H+ antiporter NhaA [Novosphingobium sp.]
MTARRHPFEPLATLATRLFGGEAGAGILLIVIAIAAMIVANSPLADGYHTLFHGTLPWTPLPKLNTLHLWINDALMAMFFFVVGLEIKREVIDGELSSPARRRLPVLAAIAGMAVPALVYLLVAGGTKELQGGWAIPAATDIAFALGVLGLLGKRAPASLRLFLLTVAIVDDLGAVTIIALFYTSGLKLVWLGWAAAALAGLIALNRTGVTRGWPYLLLGGLLWYAVLHSGVHATVAGVLAALCVPMRLDSRGDSLLLRMEHALAPISAYFIVPVFGFANAGVAFAGLGMDEILAPLPIGVALGLFVGKQVGIMGAIVLADRTGLAQRPAGASWQQLWGMSLLCGIGFTMSLFIGQLAFPNSALLVEEAKIGVLAGSLLSALLGYALLRTAPQRAP